MANLVVLIDVLLIASLLTVSSTSSNSVEAAESYCRRDLQAVWCNLFRFYEASSANGPSNFPSTSNFNATQPWVITGNDHLVFNASSSPNSSLAIRPPIWPTFNLVAMFLFGNATLEIQDTAWSSAANIYVCDNATLRAMNTTYQNEALVKFQYSIWFAGTSRGEFRDTAINTASDAAPVSMQSNVFFWVREKASFLVDNVWGSRGFFLDTMQVVVADDATSLQANTHMLEESYIAGTATTRFHNVSFTDLFFEVCPGEETLTLSHLPEVCDLAPGGAGELCFSAAHKALNYSLSPPAAPYTVEMVDTKVFSWAASLYGNSSVVLKDNPPRANIGVGMGGLFTETPGETVTVSASIGEGTSYFRGVPNRNVTVDNTSVIAWHIWASDDKGDGQKLISNYSIETTSGSDIADVLTSGDITISLANTSLNNGHLISSKSSNPVFIRGGSVNYELRARDNGGYIAVSQDTALTKDASIIADDTSAVYLYDISSSPPLASKVSTLGSGTVRSLTLTEPAFAADAVTVLEVNGLVQISAVSSQQGGGSSGGLYTGNYAFNIYNSDTHALVFTTDLPTPNVTDGWVNATFGGTGDFILQVSLATDSHKGALGHGCRRIFMIVDSLTSLPTTTPVSTSPSTIEGTASPSPGSSAATTTVTVSSGTSPTTDSTVPTTLSPSFGGLTFGSPDPSLTTTSLGRGTLPTEPSSTTTVDSSASATIIAATMRVQGDFTVSMLLPGGPIRARLEEAILLDLSFHLLIDSAHITIDGLYLGSLVIEFTIAEEKGENGRNATATVELLEGIKDQDNAMNHTKSIYVAEGGDPAKFKVGTTSATVSQNSRGAPPAQNAPSQVNNKVALIAVSLAVAVVVIAVVVVVAVICCCRGGKKNDKNDQGKMSTRTIMVNPLKKEEEEEEVLTAHDTKTAADRVVVENSVQGALKPSSEDLSVAPAGYIWDQNSGYFYSESDGYYFDHKTQEYYDPESCLWYSEATGKWYERL